MKFDCIAVLSLLLSSALFCGCREKEEPSDPVIPVIYQDGPLLTGRVCDEIGKPIADAVVTDGFTHAVTDAAGCFCIMSPYPERVRYVSVSVPSGYEAVMTDGLPVFFCAVPEYSGKERKADIRLKKLDAPQDDFTLLMTADPQVKPFELKNNSEFIAYASRDVCEDLFTDLANTATEQSGPCFGICLGDIANNRDEIYSQYRLGMSRVGIPFYNVIGNHDHIIGKYDSEDGSTLPFEAAFGPKNCSFNLGAFHVVLLDNCLYVKDSFEYPMYYGLEDWQLGWLREDLSYVPADVPVMICMHADIFDDRGPSTGSKFVNTDKFLRLLEGRDKVYVWMGHAHRGHNVGSLSESLGLPGVEAHVLARSTGVLESNEAVCADGTPRGYVMLHASGKNLEWEFHPVSVRTAPFRGQYRPDFAFDTPLPADGQMRVYPRGSYGDDFVYANIFLWDNLWQTPVLRIGGETYPMTRDLCYDLAYREIVRYYRKLGTPESSMENYVSGRLFHHFYVKVPSGAAGTGMVEVVDRFGRTLQAPVSVGIPEYDDEMLHVTADFSDSPQDVSAFMTEARWGYKLESVTIHPYGNGRTIQVAVVDGDGKLVSGGEKLTFHGNCSDTWVLEGTQEMTGYHFAVEGGTLLADEIIMHFRKLVSAGSGGATEDFVVDNPDDIEFK